MVEKPAHAFILRIWIDDDGQLNDQPAWEGVIHHVESGKRFYFETLEEVGKHLTIYMEKMNDSIVGEKLNGN